MNDDQLANELRRRAGAADVPDVLPAVHARRETVAPPVPVARWAAFAGLAGVVAVLLLAVFALPRLGGPAAGTPFSSGLLDAPPSTISAMSTPDFAALLAAGSLRGHSVVVLGDIESTQDNGSLPSGANCSDGPSGQPERPEYTCVVGRLTGADPAIWVHSEYFATGLSGDMPNPPPIDWRGFEAPTARHLVMSVDDNDRVTLLGSAGDDYVQVVRELAVRKANPVDFGTAYVVPGWITGSITPGFCPPVRSPDAWLEQLSGRRCGPESWLTEQMTTNLAGSDPSVSVRVQDGAYTSFAPAPSDQDPVEPRAGLYVVAPRLEGSGCPDVTPCWQWEVVGRITLNDADPVAAPIATPDPANTPVATEPAPPDPTGIGSAIRCEGSAAITVDDRTGSVRACSWSDSTDSRSPAENPEGNLSRLAISWVGGLCDYEVRLDEDGGLVTANVVDIGDGCRWARVRHRIVLDLADPVDATEVRVVNTPAEIPRLTPLPATPQIPAATSTPLVARSVSCGQIRADEPEITVRDWTGLVQACETETDRSLPTPERPIWLEGSLDVMWAVAIDNCAAKDTTLELWPGREPGRYVLAARMTSSEPFVPGGPVCDVATGVHTARLTLSQRIPVPFVEAFITQETGDATRSSDFQLLPNAAFELSIESKSTYSTGEPIDVTSSLVSQYDATVRCLSGPTIALGQLDGTLNFEPGPFVRGCPPDRELRAYEPLTTGFLPAVWALSEPNPLDPYIVDGQLFLPPGTYRFSVSTSFGAFGILTPLTGLDASVIVTVR